MSSARLVGRLRAYHAAMVGARTRDLDAMLDDEFVLVHITGYEQPKHEWLGVVERGEFDYHRIEVDDDAVAVRAEDGTAVVEGRGVFDATINGMRRPWRLRFSLRLARRGDDWTIMHARYTTY